MGCECWELWKQGEGIGEKFLYKRVWIEEMRSGGAVKGETRGPTIEVRESRGREGGVFDGEVVCDF